MTADYQSCRHVEKCKAVGEKQRPPWTPRTLDGQLGHGSLAPGE